MGKAVDGDDAEGAAKAASAKTRERFQQYWDSLKPWADENWRIGLRSTGNLVGFSLFPLGWSWTECSTSRSKRPLPFEDRGKRLRSEFVVIAQRADRLDLAAAQSGAAYRKKKVEDFILRMLAREEISGTLIDEHGHTMSLNPSWALEPAFTLDICREYIGFEGGDASLWFGFSTDTLNLMTAIDARHAWKSNSKPIDWLRVEGYARSLFETKGLPGSQERYVSEIADWYAANSPDERDIAGSTLRELVSGLFKEYTHSAVSPDVV